MGKIGCAVLLTLSLLAAGCRTAASVPQSAPRVRLSLGTVRGVELGETAAYLGIPYAAPPVGPRRWQAPAPPQSWAGERDATSMGEGCLQLGKDGLHPGGSEDCLQLNVWAPRHPPSQLLPVLVWIHGGFNVGGSAGIRYHGPRELDGRALAERGVVVVTFDYRVGPLGFFALPGVTEGSGNFALQDQLAVLGFVQREIAAFGGDPQRVTVAGSSAGSIDTCALLASPRSRGLIARAAMVSWPCTSDAQGFIAAQSQRIAAALGCSGAEVGTCLRQRDARAVATALPVFTQGGARFAPFIDGELVPRRPMDTLSAGAHQHVPVLLGTTANEYASILFSAQHTPVKTEGDYLQALRDHFPDAEAIAAAYPAAAFASPKAALVAVLTDARVRCPVRREALALAKNQSEPVYRYLFSHVLGVGPLHSLGAAHGTDVPFWFGNVGFDDASLTPQEQQLARDMTGAFARFIATGDPSGDGVVWPRVATGDEVMHLDAAPTPGRDDGAARCALWDARENANHRRP